MPKDEEGKASRWLALARRFVLRDLGPNDVLHGDSDHAARLERDRSRMGLTDSTSIVTENWVVINENWVVTLLLRFIREFPVIGYNQASSIYPPWFLHAVDH